MRTDILLISHIDSRYDPLVNKLSLEIMNEFPTKVVQAVGFIEGSNYNGPIANGDGIYKIYGLQMRRLPKFLGVLKKAIIVLEFLFKVIFHLITSNPKLIYCFNHVSLAGVLPYVILSKNTKLIYHARELESQQVGFSKFRKYLIINLEKFASKHMSYIVTPSNEITSWYKENLLFNEVVTLLNSPSNLGNIHLEENYFSKKFGFDDNKIIFIHVGNITNGRNIKGMVELFEKQKELGVLVLIGKIVDKAYEYISSQNFSNVFYHEPVGYDVLHNYLSRADIGLAYIEDLSKSLRLTLGNKFLDYVCAGIPVLCTSLPGMLYYLDKYKLGFTFEDDPALFAEGISISSKAIGSGFKIEIPTELTWEFQSGQFKKLISECLF